MQEICPLGSARGADRKVRPYRDTPLHVRQHVVCSSSLFRPTNTLPHRGRIATPPEERVVPAPSHPALRTNREGRGTHPLSTGREKPRKGGTRRPASPQDTARNRQKPVGHPSVPYDTRCEAAMKKATPGIGPSGPPKPPAPPWRNRHTATPSTRRGPPASHSPGHGPQSQIGDRRRLPDRIAKHHDQGWELGKPFRRSRENSPGLSGFVAAGTLGQTSSNPTLSQTPRKGRPPSLVAWFRKSGHSSI